MSDLLATGAAWLASKLAAYAAKTITIRRDAATNTVSASIGRTTVELTSEEGVTLREHVRDFLIDVADYDFGSGAVLPARGDQFDEDIGNVTATYEALPLGPDQELWRYSDPHRNKLRIHTKLIAEA